MQLPGFATIASASSDPDTWIVGARPGAQAAKIARRFQAQHIGLGGYTVAIGRARAMAGALKARHLLVYAQPNVYVHPAQVADDPLSGPPNAWRKVVADPALAPPPVTPTSPLIALVDASADTTHPEWTGDPNFRKLGTQPVTNLHGTATAAVAAARSTSGTITSRSGCGTWRAMHRSYAAPIPCPAKECVNGMRWAERWMTPAANAPG